MTGEDVANSLYYIHLDTPGDDLLAPKIQRQEAAPRGSMDSTRSTDTHRIARKPLPASAQHLQGQTPVTPVDNATTLDEQLKFSPLSQGPHNKENIPIAGVTRPLSDPFAQPSNEMPAPPIPAKVAQPPVPILRKPLGPRDLSTDPSPPSRDLPAPPPEVANPAVRRPPDPTTEDIKPPLPARPTPPPLRFDNTTSHPARKFDEIRGVRSPGHQSPVTPSRSPSPWSKQKPFTPFSLTIIRRDPGTGHQWNIGKVSSFQSTILYQDPHNPDAEPMVQYPRGYPAINVHIETSGYARFRDFPTTFPKLNFGADGRPRSAGVGGEGGNIAQSMKELAAAMKIQQQQQQQQQQADAGHGVDDSEGGFHRQVVMTYGKTWTHNLREAFKGRGGGGSGNRERSSTTASARSTDNNIDGVLEPPRAPGFHRRQDSGNSTNSNDSVSYFPTDPAVASHMTDTGAADGTRQQQHQQQHQQHQQAEQPVLTNAGPGLRPKGYSFISPWDGRCDFRTTSNGRALRCRHTRNTTSQGFNPLVAAQALRDAAMSAAEGAGKGGKAGRSRSRGLSASLVGTGGGGGGGGGGDMGNKVGVSELRFNLPATDLFNSKEDRERAAKEVLEGLGRMLVRSPGGHEQEQRYDDDEDEEPIFDFSGLGKEKAGGGNKGRRAKLGKLLIHDEGLKMLDLVVAANMGIWWQAWERSF